VADDILDVGDNLADVPAFYTGTGTSTLVPSVFPIGINGRPYMIDRAANEFVSGFEARVRDSVDQGTEPGEASINPQGLWRRNQSSWHVGAGQQYADDAYAEPFRFYTSKGINPWTKGQLSLLNSTKVSLSSANTNLLMCVVTSSAGTDYLYVADNSTLKYTTDPFATTPTWTTVSTGSPGGAITSLETNGVNVYIGYTGHDIHYTAPGSSTISTFYPTSGTTGKTYTSFGFAKGWGVASVDNDLYIIGAGSGTHTVFYTNPDTTFRWVGAAGGQNAIYVAGYAGTKSLIYKITIQSTGALDTPVVALELPVGEVVSSIYGYLGAIMLGTSKGVRYCTTDSNANLVAGPAISSSNLAKDFAAEGRYVWFGWTNYDGTSTGIGRLDLATFAGPNQPAYASDLMYTGTGTVLSLARFKDPTTGITKGVFSVSGVGVVVEDSTNLVASGTIETGFYKWGIPDRKFVARIDTKTAPLVGSVEIYISLDGASYELRGTSTTQGSVEHTVTGPEDKVISAGVQLILKRQTATTGPTVTRVSGRAYATPARSRYFKVPVLLHNVLRPWNKEYYIDVVEERRLLEDLILNPRVVIYQEGDSTYSVIAEDMEWRALDTVNTDWTWQGTAIITLRSIQE
jgi:hypothetical protein